MIPSFAILVEKSTRTHCLPPFVLSAKYWYVCPGLILKFSNVAYSCIIYKKKDTALFIYCVHSLCSFISCFLETYASVSASYCSSTDITHIPSLFFSCFDLLRGTLFCRLCQCTRISLVSWTVSFHLTVVVNLNTKLINF